VKKLLSIALVCLFSVALVGCGSETTKSAGGGAGAGGSARTGSTVTTGGSTASTAK